MKASQIISIVIGILFLLFSMVQINDPDGATWMLVYGFIAVIALFHGIRNKLYLPLLIPSFVLYLVYTIILWPASVTRWWVAEESNASSQMNMPFIEEGREAIGLLLCTLVLAYYMIKALRSGKSKIALF